MITCSSFEPGCRRFGTSARTLDSAATQTVVQEDDRGTCGSYRGTTAHPPELETAGECLGHPTSTMALTRTPPLTEQTFTVAVQRPDRGCRWDLIAPESVVDQVASRSGSGPESATVRAESRPWLRGSSRTAMAPSTAGRLKA